MTRKKKHVGLFYQNKAKSLFLAGILDNFNKFHLLFSKPVSLTMQLST